MDKKHEEELEIEDVEVNEESTQEEVNEPQEKKGMFKSKKKNKKEEALQEEVTKLQEELGNLKNEYFKAFADTENVRKRLLADAESQRKYRIQTFAQEILPAIDNLERAGAFEAKDEEMKNYVAGVNMVYEQLKAALEKEGVSPIDALNQPFDPNIHQALVSEKVEGVEAGIVVEEIQKGYMLKDRVLRASLVKVSE